MLYTLAEIYGGSIKALFKAVSRLQGSITALVRLYLRVRQMLYKLAQMDKFEPKKFFSIDRVFRNETLDATHLAEFHQVRALIYLH
jgi:phenylalanyl-tRNA synthetase alpha subunit